MARGGKGSKVGALGFTFLALILTGLTAVLLAKIMGGTKYAGEAVQEVVVAVSDIPAATRITEDHLAIAKWPVSSVPETAFKSIDELLGSGGNVAVSQIHKGEAILRPRLASAAKGTGMASLVPKSQRAMSVAVDKWVADSRLVYPGAWVDVMTTIKNPMERRTNTKLVLQRVRVLAVNGIIDPAGMNQEKKKGGMSSSNNKAIVTLLVEPHEAEVLTLAAREGKLDLILRNAADLEQFETFGVTPTDLLGLANQNDIEAAEAELAAGRTAAKANRRRRRPRRRLVETHKNTDKGPDRAGGNSLNSRSRTKTIDLGAN